MILEAVKVWLVGGILVSAAFALSDSADTALTQPDSVAGAQADSAAASVDTSQTEDSVAIKSETVSPDSFASADSITQNAANAERNDSSSIAQSDSAFDSSATVESKVQSTGDNDGAKKGEIVRAPHPNQPPNTPLWRKGAKRVAQKALALLTRNIFVRLFSRYQWHLLALVASSTIIAITVLFYTRRQERHRFMTTTRLSVMDKEVRRACKLIEKSYDDPRLTLQSLCEILVTGPAFLQALFMRELGMSVEAFIEHVRINRVRLLIDEDPALPVDQVAAQCGIADEKALKTSFSEICGITLEQYRESRRKETYA